jgi:hypothetical protein
MRSCGDNLAVPVANCAEVQGDEVAVYTSLTIGP